MNSMLSWGCALSTMIVAETAHAQAPPTLWYPPPNLAHISIQAAPATELEVTPAGASGGSAAVARCKQYCDFWAPLGRYTVHARDPGTGDRKELPLRIKKSSRFELEAGDDSTSTAGMFLGIAGAIALPIGLIALAAGASSSGDDGGATGVGLGLLLAGAIATPVGWSMYASSRTRLTRIDGRSYTRAQTASRVRLGVTGVGAGGFGLGGTVTF